jgi:hypothetical protein
MECFRERLKHESLQLELDPNIHQRSSNKDP